MSEDEPTPEILKTRNSIAKSLRSIEELALDLHAQALASPNDRDFPGGTALHMLGPAVARQSWDDQYAEVEIQSYVNDEPLEGWNDPLIYQGDTEEQPLNVLATWTRMVREESEQPTSLTPTLSREIDYLRGQLDWICRIDTYGEPEWSFCFEMASELKTLVRRMENTLHDGDRINTDAAPCFHLLPPDEARCGGTLARVNLKPRSCIHTAMGANRLATDPIASQAHKDCDQGGRDDLYRCLSCEKIYTPAEYWLAVREHMEREAG